MLDLCIATWGLFSAMIGSLHNSIHPLEMQIHPLKTVCSCPCGRVIKPVTHTVLSSTLWNAFVNVPSHTHSPLMYPTECICQRARSHTQSSHVPYGMHLSMCLVTCTVLSFTLRNAFVNVTGHTHSPHVPYGMHLSMCLVTCTVLSCSLWNAFVNVPGHTHSPLMYPTECVCQHTITH